MQHPLFLVLMTAAGIYVAKLWREDLRATRAGRPNRGAFPGATPAPRRAVAIGIAGALLLLAGETAGEIACGLDAEQSRMTWLLALYSISAAPIIEELIFRGWLVVEHRGRAALWAGALVTSVIFALLHPFLWRWDETGFRLVLNHKGLFSTAFAFGSSLWFYAARFAPWNPERSLLPCMLAHAAKNAGVVAIKAATGFVVGLW